MIRRSFAVLGLGTALLGLAAVATSVLPEPVMAQGPTFVIPANDGYGIGECVESGSPCGKVVADAWCEAQGFRRSASIGPADVETTGSIETAARRRIAVTCAQ
jgi:hypothetical protein